METDYVVEEDPYGLEIDVMDSLKPGEVPLHSTDYAGTNAPWGELMSTVAKRNGAVGCICDSQIRDCQKIIKLGFPVFYAGIRPLDSKGRARVMAYDLIGCGANEPLVIPSTSEDRLAAEAKLFSYEDDAAALLEAAGTQDDRVRAQRGFVSALSGAGPLTELPFLFTKSFGPPEVEALSRELVP